jgi:hypothetical protein
MLTGNIIKALNEHRQTVGIFCDIAKALHFVNHNILLDKFCHYGIHGTMFLWFRSYLENRRQRVEILHIENGKTSSGWETVKAGVRQHSVLSQLLFLLHINDLL